MTAEHRSPVPHGGLRASHADRDQVVERLRDAAAEGRLDLDELDARLDKALTAKTFGDLEPLTADLPSDTAPGVRPGGPPAVPPGDNAPLILKGGIHGASRTGRWHVPPRLAAFGGMGGVTLDFTRVECQLPVIEAEVHGEMAGVTLIIPPDWTADINGVDPGIGGVKNKTTLEHAPHTPLVRLTGTGGIAGVTIRHPSSRERRRLRQG